ncbi:leucine-rich repeat domain-containing protein [uncultured Microscilla sp.]|uniref:leucine-rich repeat domain-containing protein n=1 Tax=uncultured Microscilla sp. TaxID=432653 RepID=UPI00261EF98B|nr:leucine-rich repeat domain-containing protein [uncultured Microscilla sp.]
MVPFLNIKYWFIAFACDLSHRYASVSKDLKLAPVRAMDYCYNKRMNMQENEQKLVKLLQDDDKQNVALAFQLCVGLKGQYSPQVQQALHQHPMLCIRHDIEQAHTQSITHLSVYPNNVAYHIKDSRLKVIDYQSVASYPHQEGLPPEIWQMTQLTALDLSHNDLQVLPEEILQLKNLRLLCLESNPNLDLKDAFRKIKKMQSLRSLELSHINYKNLPIEIQQLRHIKQLGINFSHFMDEKDTLKKISHLAKLESLYLHSCSLFDLPKEISLLKSLHTLSLENNELDEFPAELAQLPQLKRLSLRDNQLTELPDHIGALKNLEMLCVENNALEYISGQIGQLTQLKEIYLAGNQLTELPSEIAQLEQLQVIDININPVAAQRSDWAHKHKDTKKLL